MKFNENFFTNGSITLLGNKFGMQGVNISEVTGTTDFTGNSANVDVKGLIGKSPMSVKASVNKNIADVNFQ